MKNIPPSSFPNFNGMESEDPYTLLFEFDVLYRGYDYVTYDQNLNLFLATLKNVTLLWFMGFGGNNIGTWVDMKKAFLKNYQDYYKDKDCKEEIFRMTQKEDKILKD
jgi:hypothetical protein